MKALVEFFGTVIIQMPYGVSFMSDFLKEAPWELKM